MRPPRCAGFIPKFNVLGPSKGFGGRSEPLVEILLGYAHTCGKPIVLALAPWRKRSQRRRRRLRLHQSTDDLLLSQAAANLFSGSACTNPTRLEIISSASHQEQARRARPRSLHHRRQHHLAKKPNPKPVPVIGAVEAKDPLHSRSIQEPPQVLRLAHIQQATRTQNRHELPDLISVTILAGYDPYHESSPERLKNKIHPEKNSYLGPNIFAQK